MPTTAGPTPSSRSRSSWRGGARSLGARVARTYAAVAGAVLLATAVGFPLAHLASQQGEGWDGLGYFLITLGLAAVGAVVLSAAASLLLDLGWATVVGLLAVAVPFALTGALQSGTAALLVALVWPGAVALAVHGRLGTALGVAALALLPGLGATWVLEQRREDRVVASVTAELERSGVTLYGPPDEDGVTWGHVMVLLGEDVHYALEDDGREYRVKLTGEAPTWPGRPELADGDVVEQRMGALARRGDTWIEVTVSRPSGQIDPREAREAGATFAESLVERSPEWLGERSREIS